MSAPLQMERLFARITLVRGRGSRRQNRLCLMTFVALLAGERHTDAPRTASPFIRRFAIRLNDGMPDDQRQKLKVFAPRIIGTNDEHDSARTETTRAAFANEILPRLLMDGAPKWLSEATWERIKSYTGCGFPATRHASFAAFGWGGATTPDFRAGAHEAADLLVSCARAAPFPIDRAWYWAKAIEVLDRLCDVGSSPVVMPVGAEAVARAEFLLNHPPVRAVLAAIRDRLQKLTRRAVARPGQSSKTSAPATRFRLVVRRPSTTDGRDEVWTIASISSPTAQSAGPRPSVRTKSKTPLA